jgi:hypothetical protein
MPLRPMGSGGIVLLLLNHCTTVLLHTPDALTLSAAVLEAGWTFREEKNLLTMLKIELRFHGPGQYTDIAIVAKVERKINFHC